MSNPALISVKNLSRRFADHDAVKHISFQLQAGDILGFLGPNGAGKSTTMQMLSGNLAPSEGEISINGIDLFEQPRAAKAALGYLPDTPPLYRDMTVREFLTYCAKLHRIKKSEIKNRLQSTLQRCGLLDVQSRLIANLSKGFQQRVGIAQAILHSPPVIILDEPTVGLDPIQIIEIRSLIKELGKSHGIILCSHILPEVQEVCTRVQIIHRGELVYEAAMDSFQQQRETGWFEISFTQETKIEVLLALQVIEQIKQTDSQSYLVYSSSNADDLCKILAKQSWGLYRFTPHQQTLEQKFIELTLTETVTS